MKNDRPIFASCVLALICAFAPLPSVAFVWNEGDHGDAGELTGTAQIVTGSGFLTQINGTTSGATDRDLYQIYIADALTFSIEVTSTGTNNDSLLALFNTSGFGLVYNDDINTNINNVDLHSKLDFTAVPALVTNAGFYYLAVMGSGQEFTSLGGTIWLEQAPWTDQKAPDGPGAGGALNGYTGIGSSLDDYTITLSGVTSVPEPTTVALALIAGVAAIGASRRRSVT